MRPRVLRLLLALSIAHCALGLGPWALGIAPVFAQGNMPDPSLIHGKAIGAPELPAGSVTVRVVRESIGNNLPGQMVTVTSGATRREAKTDDQGRANFDNLQTGVEARAEVVVNGERLVSDPFTPPASGGLRVILIAGLEVAAARKAEEEASAAAAPPVKGVVVFNPNSRIMLEFKDDNLQVFYVLEVLNTARARVDIGGPLIVDLPDEAAGATVLQGSSPSATVSGDILTVTGPFAAGVTSVQVGFTLPYSSPNLTIEQQWPAAMQQLTVGMQKIGSATMASPQFSTVGEVNTPDGTPYWLANGEPLAAGATLTLQLKDLPIHSRTPRYVALSLAAAVILTGAWLAFGPRPKDDAAKRKLVERRNRLLNEIATLDDRHRRGAPAGAPADARYSARRQQLVSELEQVYGELDEEEGAGPRGGGEGVAA